MYIYEVVKKAMEEGRCIKRKDWGGLVNFARSEISTFDGYLRIDGENWRFANWSPTPEDLMADDWEVVDTFTEEAMPNVYK